MCSEVLFIFMSRVLLYSAWSGVNRVQVVLSGFSVNYYFLSKQKLYVGLVACISWLVHRCDGDFICVGHDRHQCSGW